MIVFTAEEREILRQNLALKTQVHDGLVFHWTTSAIRSGKDLIGFHFDHLGLPQQIYRNSIYGGHILRWESGVLWEREK